MKRPLFALLLLSACTVTAPESGSLAVGDESARVGMGDFETKPVIDLKVSPLRRTRHLLGGQEGEPVAPPPTPSVDPGMPPSADPDGDPVDDDDIDSDGVFDGIDADVPEPDTAHTGDTDTGDSGKP